MRIQVHENAQPELWSARVPEFRVRITRQSAGPKREEKRTHARGSRRRNYVGRRGARLESPDFARATPRHRRRRRRRRATDRGYEACVRFRHGIT